MYPLLGISANASYTPPISIGANGSITPTSGLLATDLSLFAPGLSSGGASTIVELSATGQLLSAVATFQDQLAALQSGTTSGGQTYGTDVASLAAEAQRLADTFNGLQNSIAGINGNSSLLGGSIPGSSGLVQALNSQALASYSNGSSALTNLSQLGIVYQPAQVPGGAASLNVNLNTLESAFNSDASGAFSLLSTAANAFSSLASNYAGQSGSQLPAIGSLEQAFLTDQLLSDSLLSQVQTNGNVNLVDLLALASLSPSGSGGASTQQIILAMNEYALVSSLLG